MKTLKKYRVDTFKDNKHIKKYFNNEGDARANAKTSVQSGDITFLLKLIECTGKYDVVCQILN